MAPRQHDGCKIPKTVTSCASCLAWGRTANQGLCRPCYAFIAPHYHHDVGQCGACGRHQPLKKGYCRLCWCQAEYDRRHCDSDSRSLVVMAPHLQRVRHHQLFLMVAARRKAKPRTAPRRFGEKGRPRKPPPPVVARPRTDWAQLPLFTDRLRRDYRYRHDLRKDPSPDSPWLAWALRLAHTTAEARGWAPQIRGAMQRNLIMLLSAHTTGEAIYASDVHDAVKQRNNSVTHTIEILQTMGILLDDRPITFEVWLQRKLTPLATDIAAATRQWAHTLRDGGPRTRARNPATVTIFVRCVQPALLAWSARHDTLRQVTRDDVLTYTTALNGSDRTTTLAALRSLFTWAKRNGLIFANPTAAIKGPRRERPIFQPLRPQEIAQTIHAATSLQAKVFVVLAAVHAARPASIRALRLDDIDLGNRQLTIAGRTRPLDELSYRVLVDWLEHRRRRWPNTANPHVLISARTAVGTGPVSATWLRNLRGLPATVDRLRVDRQLEEALAHRADPLRLAAVFGIDTSTAIRYADSARQLLQRPHESDSTDLPRTHASKAATRPGPPPGSG